MRKNLIFACLLGTVASFSWTSCKKDEPTPEVIVDPMEQSVLYYITGRVADEAGKPLSGVSVGTGDIITTSAADGTFAIELADKGKSYPVNFTKEGFLSATAPVAIPQNAANRSSVTHDLILYKAAAAVTVTPEAEATVASNCDYVSLYVPVGAVATEQQISITAAGVPAVAATKAPALAEVVCTPSGLTFETPVTLTIKNPVSATVNFSGVQLFYLNPESQSWVKEDAAVMFDEETDTYQAPIAHFSAYAVRPKLTYTLGKEVVTDHENALKQVDNCGKMNAVADVEISIKERKGWEYAQPVLEAVKAAFPALAAAEQQALAERVDAMITNHQGTPAGAYDVALPALKCAVSGNAYMYYQNKAKQRTDNVAFVLSDNGAEVTLTIPVKVYCGMSEIYTNTDCDTHSGGSGN